MRRTTSVNAAEQSKSNEIKGSIAVIIKWVALRELHPEYLKKNWLVLSERRSPGKCNKESQTKRECSMKPWNTHEKPILHQFNSQFYLMTMMIRMKRKRERGAKASSLHVTYAQKEENQNVTLIGFVDRNPYNNQIKWILLPNNNYLFFSLCGVSNTRSIVYRV